MNIKNSFNEEYFSLDSNGRRLYGIIHNVENPKAIVISAHGLNGERVDAHRILVLFSRQCAQNEVMSVRFDFSGCGVSENRFFESSISIRIKELASVVEYITDRFKGIPVILHGFSDGCRIVYDSFGTINPSAYLLWSPILLPSQAEDANLDDVPWQRLQDEKWPVKPFLGLWLGFTYIKEYGKLKTHGFENKSIAIFKGEYDKSVDDSISTIKNSVENSSNISIGVIKNGGHIYETHEATNSVIQNSIEWIRSVANCD